MFIHQLKMSLLANGFLFASAGALIYGGWAFFINAGAGLTISLTTAIVQGGFSFALTLSLSLAIEHLRRIFGTSVFATVEIITLASTSMFMMAYIAQWLAGSSQVLTTILPGWLIGSVYAAAYTMVSVRGPLAARIRL